jgi:hypothetical protein
MYNFRPSTIAARHRRLAAEPAPPAHTEREMIATLQDMLEQTPQSGWLDRIRHAAKVIKFVAEHPALLKLGRFGPIASQKIAEFRAVIYSGRLYHNKEVRALLPDFELDMWRVWKIIHKVPDRAPETCIVQVNQYEVLSRQPVILGVTVVSGTFRLGATLWSGDKNCGRIVCIINRGKKVYEVEPFDSYFIRTDADVNETFGAFQQLTVR